MEGETTIQKSNKRQTQKTGNKQYYYVTIDQPADQLCHSQHQWGWHCETPPTGQVCLCMAENKKWHLVSVQQYRCAIAKMIHKILEVFLCFSDFFLRLYWSHWRSSRCASPTEIWLLHNLHYSMVELMHSFCWLRKKIFICAQTNVHDRSLTYCTPKTKWTKMVHMTINFCWLKNLF